MANFLAQGCILFIFIAVCGCVFGREQYSPNCENGVCYRNEDAGPCVMNDDKPRLYRWEPIRKGFIRELELEPGKMYKMITHSNKPPIFEIPNFLSKDEQEHVKQLAVSKGLSTSNTHFDETLLDKHKSIQGHSHGVASMYRSWDADDNGYISKQEIALFGEKFKYLYMSPKEVNEMIHKLDLKQLDDGRVTIDEWLTFPTASIVSYMDTLLQEHPVHKDRFSNQAWIPQDRRSDPVMKRLRERTQKLTKLPIDIIRGSEPVQVVRYTKDGHYNVHYDSQPINQNTHFKCCHQKESDPKYCRLCRYATVLYYLSEVPGGGATAFPVADKDTYNETTFVKERKGNQYNLMQYCKNANLQVKPERGKAILWYNHFVDESTGFLGDLDNFTLHGGCGVTKGHKWIANNWITAPDLTNINIESQFDDSKDDDNTFRTYTS